MLENNIILVFEHFWTEIGVYFNKRNTVKVKGLYFIHVQCVLGNFQYLLLILWGGGGGGHIFVKMFCCVCLCLQSTVIEMFEC